LMAELGKRPVAVAKRPPFPTWANGSAP